MKIDYIGLTSFNELDKKKQIFFKNPITKSEKVVKSDFYNLATLDNYIIKIPHKKLNKEDYLTMLKIFNELKDKITLTDFPIGYYEEDEILKGTVIPYYKNSVALLDIVESKSLDVLKKYYYHNDDKLHNLYILLNEILTILEELQNNNISYIDSNPSNIIIKDNQVKLIDFEPQYLRYGSNNQNIKTTLYRFDDLVYCLHSDFKLDNLVIYQAKNFTTMRKHLVKLENKIRKKIR